MHFRTALIITSISKPNPVLISYAEGSLEHEVDFIVIGDVKSPIDFDLSGCDFWSIKRQHKLDFQLAKILPENHYSRKNLGYLIAMNRGAEVIVETDDDNFPENEFWNERVPLQTANLAEEFGWINVYSYFTSKLIWPRGYPLELCKQQVPPLEEFKYVEVNSPIQQGLANDNPDVDAVYRMILPLPLRFDPDIKLLLGKGTWCPFNSQNTTWFPDAFPLLYLPSFCSFRMTDIWRSFVAQRICWENSWPVLFHGPTVGQERNKHNLLNDLSDEVPGYLNNTKICSMLERLNLKPGRDRVSDNMLTCYHGMIELGVIGRDEIRLLEAWLSDLDDSFIR